MPQRSISCANYSARDEVIHTIGLVVPQRGPMTPLLTTLVAEAKKLAVKASDNS
jgi:hypothetical protein